MTILKILIFIWAISLSTLCNMAVVKLSEHGVNEKTYKMAKQNKPEQVEASPKNKTIVLYETPNKDSESEKVLVLKPFFKLIKAYHQSEEDTMKFYNAINEYSEEFSLDGVIVAALIANECSFNINAKHARVRVNTRNGKVTTRAIGAGIIYEIWAKELKRVGVNSKSELRDIDTNVKATCYILKILRNRQRVKGTSSITQSMVLRYYGIVRKNHALDKTYYARIVGIIDRYLT